MCLVLLVLRAHPDVNLLLAGNRDEFRRRPSAPPSRSGADPAIFAGRDLEAGGSWMGRNSSGMLAALTNRRSDRPEPAEALSRGAIVMGLLGRSRPGEAAAWLAGLALHRYRPFGLLFGNGEHFYHFSSEEGRRPTLLGPGCYALSNSSLDDRSWPKVERSHQFFGRNLSLAGEELIRRMQLFLGDATPPGELPSGELLDEIHGPPGAVFIRGGEYGTVSSSILTSGGALGERYYYAGGEALERNPATAYQRIALQD